MKFLFLIPLIFLAFPALAQHQPTFVYAKTIIRIIPKAMPEPAPAANNDKKPTVDPSGMMPVLSRGPKEFTVEVRTPSFLAQKDFISLQPFTDREGMLILVDPPARAQISATHMIASADVLFVDADGIIIKIAPNLKLSTLTETIDSELPIRAFVYLKAGTTAADDIAIGDRIENNAFKTHPQVIQ
jgi:uncharacterized membrane protein (UPF0127 family)